MSAHRIQAPIYVVKCDADGCAETYTPGPTERFADYVARSAAKRAGWSVRPNYGKGSRTALDLCLNHREGT